MAKYDVLVCGEPSVDIVFPKIAHAPKPGEEIYCDDFIFTGGASFTTAVALSRLGLKVGVAGITGNDFLSNFIVEQLHKEGVSTDYMKKLNYPLRTLSVAINYEDDRSFLSYQDPLRNSDIEQYRNEVLQNVDSRAVHISAERHAESTIAIAKQKESIVSLDVGWDKEWLSNPLLLNIIKKGDIFTPNLKEAIEITKQSSPEQCINEMNNIAPGTLVIIKLSDKGAVFKEHGLFVNVPTSPKEAIDTTGAGDVFAAGVLAGILYNYDSKKAVQLGNFCAGKSVEGLGGATFSPYKKDISEEFKI